MKILVTGAHGLVGSALVSQLRFDGHAVVCAVRGGRGGDASSPGQVGWDVNTGIADTQAIEGIDAAIHLAGESLTDRWTAAKKRAILESRTAGTRALVQSLARLRQRPRLLICASAIGFYGNRGDEMLDEYSPAGSGFLSEVVRQWEQSAAAAENLGVRTVFARFGIVLSPRGGALSKMLPIFRTGLAGPLGSGRQFMSWIALDDTVRALVFLLNEPTLRGAVNVTAPNPVRNREFAQTLGRVLRRPAILPVPAAALRLTMGEMADELLLSSTRVRPLRLQQTGFEFRWPTLEAALEKVLR